MTSPDISSNLNAIGYEIARGALQQTVDEAGGFQGVYEEFRTDHQTALHKYMALLDCSIAPEEQQRNEAAFISGNPDRTVREHSLERINRIAEQQGIGFHEAMAFYMAVNIVRTAAKKPK